MSTVLSTRCCGTALDEWTERNFGRPTTTHCKRFPTSGDRHGSTNGQSKSSQAPTHSDCTILLNYHQLGELKILEARDPTYCISSTSLASGWAWFCPIGHEKENSPVVLCLQTILGSGLPASERVACHAKPQKSRLTQIKHEVP